MYIMPNDNNVSMQGNSMSNAWKAFKKRVGQKALDTLPEHTQEESAKKLAEWRKTDEFISDPMYNRGIMGFTALATQPAIDSYNHKVDEETREVSVLRKIGKIIGCTTVGMFCVRGPMREIVKKMTDLKGNSKYSKALLPKAYLVEMSKNEKFLKNYRSALTMGLALVVMSFTNFLLDAPVSAFITNVLLDKRSARKKAEERAERKEIKEVA